LQNVSIGKGKFMKIRVGVVAGKLADFLVLSHDILTIAEGQLRTVHPEETYVGGRKVFSTAGSGL
jgi:predicted amidohydrolase YtcJ